nr:hypothetical protein [Tanacetum cinerariifolium]
MKVKESLNVTFEETPPPPKTSPLEDDDLVEKEAIEVYVAQSLKLIDFAKPNHVYRLMKALYRLKQAPKAWYDRLEDSKPMKTPMSTEMKLTKEEESEFVDNTKYRGMIGILLYLTASSPEIMFSVFLYARFQEDPKTSHLEAVKRIFRYIKGTMHLGLWYPKGSGIETKQTALAISTTEAEYISVGKACQQALWMKQALVDYVIHLDDIPIMCDNKGAIDLRKSPIQHSRTKHIKIRHHFFRDNVQKGNITIEKVPSKDNIADLLTKPLK